MILSPVHNKHAPQYLVIDGHLTRLGYNFLKLMNVYSKAGKFNKVNKTGLTSEKKAGLKQIMGKYPGKASLSTIRENIMKL